MEDFKVNVKDEAEGRKLQEIVFASGRQWAAGETHVQYPFSRGFKLYGGRLLINGGTEYANPTMSYEDFVGKYGHVLIPCNTGEEEEYDG